VTLSHDAEDVEESDETFVPRSPSGQRPAGAPRAHELGYPGIRTSSRKLREPVRGVRTRARSVDTGDHTLAGDDPAELTQTVIDNPGSRVQQKPDSILDGFPFTVNGLDVKKALHHVPPLPDQESCRVLWILVACWIGSANFGDPKQSLRAFLLALRDLLNLQVTVPTSWVGLTPGHKCQASVRLCAEFGPLEFTRACLGVSAFFILLHHDSNVVALYSLFCEVEQTFTQWCDTLGVHPWGS